MPGLVAPLAYVLAFVAVVVLSQSIAGLVFASRDRTQRVSRRLTALAGAAAADQRPASLVRRAAAPRISAPFLLKWHGLVESRLQQAGLTFTPVQLLSGAGAGAGLLWLGALFFSRSQGAGGLLVNGLVSLLAAITLAGLGAWLWVGSKRTARIKQIERQLPIALDIVIRALRAGHPVISAVRLAADELGDPISAEFGLIVDETAYGFDFREALVNFARRTGSADAHFFAVSISIQSETGGNLAEILEGLATVMRGRHTLSQRIKSLSSEGRASAILISVLPIFMIAVQTLIHPRVYTDKFSDPIFWPVVFVTGVIYLSGWLMVRRIINFRY